MTEDRPSNHSRPIRHFPTPKPRKIDLSGIQESFGVRMTYSIAKDEHTATVFDAYQALAFAVRDRLIERWFATQDSYYRRDAKRVYYLSMEFLMGRALGDNLFNLTAYDLHAEAMAQLGLDIEELREQEMDAGLGNGGLGRLAACFLDSAATLAIPFYGYGIRYEYGIFRQHIVDGQQVESPDNWLRYGNPWEIPRPDSLYPVRFNGRVQPYRDNGGAERMAWVGAETVMAMAYDTPVVGFGNDTVNSLRLWSAKSTREFDLAKFNTGEYVQAVEDKNATENISKVLYPADETIIGKELRLKQQYFFVSATLQDVVRRFLKKPGRSWDELPDKVAVQLNDTHPAIAIPEMVRVLVDHHDVDWDKAWELTQRTFAYTNHTVLPEALEKWPAELLGRLLPRHLQIIEEIDRRFRKTVGEKWPADPARVGRMAVVSDGDSRQIHMSRLAIVGSHSVNGVARLHTEILERDTFAEFAELYPGRFNCKTNGITPRRWLLKCNRPLAALVTEAIGEGWVKDLTELRRLEVFAEDVAFRERWRAVKVAAKKRLGEGLDREVSHPFDPEALLDCQVKRFHEYKRQFLNCLHVLALWHRLHDGDRTSPPRQVLFAGKAAPGYALAKLTIRFIHAVATLVNSDPVAKGRLGVVFVPNYSVTAAEKIFPACELSEQISTAGMEASGTGNMKAALNGALTIGTLDGANIEIGEEVGAGNIFIFGHTAPEVDALRKIGYNPKVWVESNPELARVIATITEGPIGKAEPGVFDPLVDSLLGNDRWFTCADFASYVECQKRAAETWKHPDDWTRMSIRNVAGMGKFSSDRTIRQYADEIWKVESIPVKFGE
jgi:starch phosphorylase